MGTVWPAMVRVALRGSVEKLLPIAKVTVLDPVLVPPETSVIQLTLLVALQLQLLEEALTARLNRLPSGRTDSVTVDTVNEQVEVLLAAAWVTVTDFPAMVSVALRAVVAVLAAVASVTVPVPVPLAPEVMVIQLGRFAVVHAQVVADGVTVTVLVVAPAPTVTLVVDRA
jgi:hypothetical protein